MQFLPIWIYTHNMKILRWELLSVALIPLVFYYFFQFNNLYTLIAFLLGALSLYFLLNKNSLTIYFAILSGILIYFFKYDLVFLPAYLIGANLAYLYIYFSHKSKSNSKIIEMNLLNAVLLTSLVFQSSIEKFRGFNKLVLQETSFTVLIIILIPIAIYFLLKIFNINKIVIFLSTVLISLSYFFLCYTFFKEIGVATILVPILSGLVAGVVNLFVKNRSIVIDINEFVLLILIPYQVSGLLGICLSILSGFIYIAVIGSTINKNFSSYKNTVSKLIPILFIFASSEINENKGVINRFNIVSGYQTAWIFIMFTILEYLRKYIDKLRKILVDNEIEKSIPLFICLFTIVILAIIIRLGGSEAISSLPIVISIYLFLFSFVESRKKLKDIEPIQAMSGFLGAISFWVLTRI